MDSKLLIGLVVGTVAAFIFGWIWYSALFGKTWQKEVGMTEEDIKDANMLVTHGGSFLMMLVIGFGIMAVISFHPNPETETYSLGKAHGLVHGLMAGGFFLAPCLAINYFYQQKSLKLWLIDAGYQVIFAGIIGLVVGLFYF